MNKLSEILVKGWFYLAISALLAFSCSLDIEDDTKVLYGQGPVVSLDLTVDSIHSILHFGIGDMIVKVDSVQKVTVKAQQNIIDEMIYNTDDEVFFWGYKENVKIADTSEPIIWEINLAKELEFFRLAGVGVITISGQQQNSLDIELTGFGDIDAFGLELERCDVYLPGVGNVKVFVNEKLTGLISGQGVIYYKGNPLIQVPVTGIGNVIDEN